MFIISEDLVSVSLVITPKGKPDDLKSGDIPVPHFKRGKAESVKAYMQRMENETQHVLFLTKNQIDRRPELEADGQDGPKNKGKSERKKEWVYLESVKCAMCVKMGRERLANLGDMRSSC